MSDMTVKKDPAVLAGEIRFLFNQAQGILLNYAIEIGRRLTEAKAILPHGQWGNWLENEGLFSQSKAQQYMAVFREYGSEQVSLFGDANSQAFGNLTFTKALKLLSVPADEREEFVETHNVEKMSTRELDKAIRERDEAKKALEQEKEYSGSLMDEADKFRKAAEEAEKKADENWEKADRLRKELEDLQNRPVEVAVQAPTEEMLQEIRAEEEKKFQQEREALEKKVADAEAKAKKQADKVKDLKAKADKVAEEAKAELQKDMDSEKAARAAAEAEKKAAEIKAAELEKKLKMADSSIATFQVYFQSVQEDLNRMIGLIKKSEPEQAGKMTQAMKALLDSVGKLVG